MDFRSMLTITTAVAASLTATGCGPSDDGWTADNDTAICTDRQGQRVADENCRRGQTGGSNPFLWYYIGRNSALPYYGERATGGSFTHSPGRAYSYAPAETAMTRSAASSISRGGFGSSAESSGGGGE